jgi:hypothetical protein
MKVCPHCTFINESHCVTCKMCLLPFAMSEMGSSQNTSSSPSCSSSQMNPVIIDLTSDRRYLPTIPEIPALNDCIMHQITITYGSIHYLNKKVFLSSASNTQYPLRATEYSCGYMNLHTLSRSIANLPHLTSFIHWEILVNWLRRPDAQTVPVIQALIEEAWNLGGMDSVGAEYLGRLVGTKKWIGATEVVSLMRYFGVDAKVVDFKSDRFPGGQSEMAVTIIRWLYSYYTKVWSNVSGAFIENEVFIPPIYMQYQGHSVTIVGIEVREDLTDLSQANLLVFDPGATIRDIEFMSDELSCGNIPSTIRRPALQMLMLRNAFQLVYVTDQALALNHNNTVIVGEDPAFVINLGEI